MTNEFSRVYIIGAGASCPYGLPTLKTLLWDLCEHVTQYEREILIKAIYEACGVDLKRPEDSPDFEEFLNRLNAQSLLYLSENEIEMLSSLRSRAGFIALDGLRSLIREKSQEAAHTEGPYDSLVKSLRVGEVVVSFNWDVLIEVAFHRLNRKYTYLHSEYANNSTLLLKPHGCISWFALLDRELLLIDTKSNVSVFGNDLNYYMLQLKDPLGPLNMGNSSDNAKSALSPLAAIVPPSSRMTLSVGGHPRDGWVESGHLRAMRAIWSSFRSAIENASEIVVIGYSLPGTDLAAIEVMKEFGASNKNNWSAKSLLIVDKNINIVERYRRIVWPTAERICDDFSKFFPDIP